MNFCSSKLSYNIIKTFNISYKFNFKGCDSNYEVKCSNFKKSRYKWNIYIYLELISIMSSSVIHVHIVKCKVDVSFVATFKNWKKYLPQNWNHNL